MGEAGGVLHEASSVMTELAGRLEDATEGAERDVVSGVFEDVRLAFTSARGSVSRMGAHLEALAAHARSCLPPLRAAEHAAHEGLLWGNRIAEKLASGGLATGRFLDGQTWEGWLNELPGSAKGVVDFPLGAGALRAGSTAAQARQAAHDAGFHIPDNYVTHPARNARGWVFRRANTEGNANTIRVMEPDAKGYHPDGYVRIYDAKGKPLDMNGNELGDPGVGEAETHFDLPPDVP